MTTPSSSASTGQDHTPLRAHPEIPHQIPAMRPADRHPPPAATRQDLTLLRQPRATSTSARHYGGVHHGRRAGDGYTVSSPPRPHYPRHTPSPSASGADLLWRAKTNLRPEHLQTLQDDSWLARIHLSTDSNAEPITVRVIDYTLDDGRDNPQAYRLCTTIVDPAAASATELAAAYVQRWEIELAFDELKTHQRGPRTVLRSKSPHLVRQEIWGHLCCHYAIRSLMTKPPCTPGTTRTGSASSPRSGSTASPLPYRALSPPECPGGSERLWRGFMRRLIARLNPARRLRAAPRVIKRMMPRWHVKRAHHTDWPQPQQPATYTAQAR